MANNQNIAEPLTPSQQYQLLKAVGIEDGGVFSIDIIGEGWTLKNLHGVIEVLRGPSEPRTNLHGIVAFWMLGAYANARGIAGFSVGFTNLELEQVAVWVRGLPRDIRPYEMQKACGRFWANFKRDVPMRGDA